MGKVDNFSEWYNDVIERADLIDKRYPIKGMDVWRPYGWSVMRAIDGFTREEMARTGHQEVMFPVFIPKTEFMKEADQIKGFGGEVYWVTKGGNNDLDVPLVVRPTSETAMYPMFSLWVRSHKDLPLKIYQIVQVFRYETKQTRSFMRVRQIHFFEAHTAHVDYEDAERQIHEDIDVWFRIAEKLAIPTLLHRRPDWDKFPGAHYTVGADAVLPELRTLQIATFHHYKDNFARAYDITYEGEDEVRRHAHQTTYGMSERLLGAIVSVHGDDKGLMLPPDVAPHQAVIVPILFKGKEAPVLEACEAQATALRHAGFRVHVDRRDETAGFKYNDWEMRGVPVRIEIGPRDVEKGTCVLVRRDQIDAKGPDGKALKAIAPLAELPARLGDALAAYKSGLLARATALLESSIHSGKSLDEIKAGTGVFRVGWCGEESCGIAIQDKTEKAVLGVPIDVAFGEAFADEGRHAGGLPGKGFKGHCAACGKETTVPVDVAKPY